MHSDKFLLARSKDYARAEVENSFGWGIKWFLCIHLYRRYVNTAAVCLSSYVISLYVSNVRIN